MLGNLIANARDSCRGRPHRNLLRYCMRTPNSFLLPSLTSLVLTVILRHILLRLLLPGRPIILRPLLLHILLLVPMGIRCNIQMRTADATSKSLSLLCMTTTASSRLNNSHQRNLLSTTRLPILPEMSL